MHVTWLPFVQLSSCWFIEENVESAGVTKETKEVLQPGMDSLL
jgi:hypothetical protein